MLGQNAFCFCYPVTCISQSVHTSLTGMKDLELHYFSITDHNRLPWPWINLIDSNSDSVKVTVLHAPHFSFACPGFALTGLTCSQNKNKNNHPKNAAQREREREGCRCAFMCVLCICAYMRVCMWVCMRVCMSERERERERVCVCVCSRQGRKQGVC